MSAQRIGENLWRSQPTNPLTGKRLSILGATRDECIARRHVAKQAIWEFKNGLKTADELSGVLVGCEARRVVGLRELWGLWADDLEQRAKRGVVTKSWARQCRACGELHLGSLGDRHPSELRAHVVESWLQGLHRWHRGAGHEEARDTGELLSEQHQRAVWAKLQACVRWGMERRLVGSLPWSRAPQFAERRPRERDATRDGVEFKKLLLAASERDRLAGNGDLMMRVGIVTLLGLRAGEAVALAWDQVRELPDGRVEVNVQFQRRTHERREERQAGRPMSPPKWGSTRNPTYAPDHPVVPLLKAQRARLEALGLYRSTGPVFPTRRGGWRGRDVVKPKDLRKLAREAGLERRGARWVQHSLRHSAGTLAAAGGATRPEIRDFLGHSSLEVTEAYFHRALGGANGDAAGKELMRALGATASAVERTREMFALPSAPLDSLDPVAVEVERPEKDAARSYKEKQLDREIYDAGEAFKEWLDMGAPIEAKKTRGAREAPPLVRRAARNAGERGARRMEKSFPEAWNDNPVIVTSCKEKLAKARELSERATFNKWKGLRRKLAREALQAGAELPEHVRAWLGQ